MPKIKITTDRQPWAAGRPHGRGAEVEVSEAEATALIAANFAETMDAPAPKSRRAAAAGDNQ